MPRPTDTIIDFRGGLASVVSPYTRPVVRKLQNAWLSPSDVGAVQPTLGFSQACTGSVTNASQFNSVHAGVNEVTFTPKIFGGVDLTTSSQSLVLVEASTYTALKTGLTEGAILDSAQINNHLVFVNGVNTPFQVDLSDNSVSNVGVASRPDVTNASTSAGSLAGGKVKGVVEYWLAEITGSAPNIVESALSASFGQIDCANGSSVNINLTHADFSGNNYRVYRTLANGTQPFLLFNEVAGGSTYVDNVPDNGDSESDGLTNLPYLHGDAPPSDIVSIVENFNRLWGITKDGDLYWPDLPDHNSWWTTSDGNFTPIGNGDGDEATKVVAAPDGLHVFKRNHLYYVYCRDVAQMQVTPIFGAKPGQRMVGCPNGRAAIATPHGVAFYHDANIYLLNGVNSLQTIGDEISDQLRTFRDQGDDTTDVALGYSALYNQLWVSWTVSATIKSMLYDFSTGRWVGEPGFFYRDFVEAGGEMYAAGGFNATNQEKDIHKLYDTATDSNSDNLTTVVEISPVFGSSPNTDKLWQWVDVIFDRETGASDAITLRVWVDSDSTNVVDSTVELDESGSTQTRLRRRVNLGIRGRELTIQIRSTTADPQWTVYAVSPAWIEYASTSRVA